MKFATLLVVLASGAQAFAPPATSRSWSVATPTSNVIGLRASSDLDKDTEHDLSSSLIETTVTSSDWIQTATKASSVVAATLLSSPLWANAAGPDWGLFEGRTGSLIHPVMMGGLFLYSLYTAYLGFQWRRQRTLGDEISALKATIPAPVEDAPPSAAAMEIEAQVKALQQERKDLAAAGPRDQHFSQGATLAFLGTAVAIEGCLNTFSRAGKLFPGPHLYAGAALVVLWGLAVSTVPAMQKGNDTARIVHISANVLSLSFFAWQVTTGLPILFKVVELTKWP